MPLPAPRVPASKAPAPTTTPELTATPVGKLSATTAPLATETAPAAPRWSREFDSTWNLIGHALHVHVGVDWSRAVALTKSQDWWAIGGDVARLVLAIARKDWVGVSLAVNQLLHDVGIEATAEQLRAIAKALAATADTLPLDQYAPPPPSPAVDSGPAVK